MKLITTPIAFALAAILAMLFATCANPLDILGPRDNPKVVTDQWNQIRVIYWISSKKQGKEIERSFMITDPLLITRLKSKLIIRKTDGLSIGSGTQLVFKGPNGDVWHGDVVFEDTLYLAMSSDAWRSYCFTLESTDFYQELREICAQNERKYHPQATAKHIILRSNLSFDYPKL